MIGFVIGLGVGLIVGWNLLPQPAWVKNMFDRSKDEVDKIVKK